MAKRKIARRDDSRHIGHMSEDVRTLREASQAIVGLRREFGYFKWYLLGVVAVFGAGFWMLHSQIGEIGKQTTEIARVLNRLDGRFEGLEKRLAELGNRQQTFRGSAPEAHTIPALPPAQSAFPGTPSAPLDIPRMVPEKK